jgi:hypothetical protein
MVTPPSASIVKTSPAPPVYVMLSSLAGEFWFWATTVHFPTRQGSTAAADVALADEGALGNELALGKVVMDPPHAASAVPAEISAAITSVETVAGRP